MHRNCGRGFKMREAAVNDCQSELEDERCPSKYKKHSERTGKIADSKAELRAHKFQDVSLGNLGKGLWLTDSNRSRLG